MENNYQYFFYNGSVYDFHFLTEELLKYENQYKKVNVLPIDSENYISITFGDKFFKLVFKDSIRFLQASIDKLSKSLSNEKYELMKQHFSEEMINDLEYWEYNKDEKKMGKKF